MVIRTFQKEILKHFGHLRIESTHGLNAYDFNLYTSVTNDEFENGVPVAFCISNQDDTMLFQKKFS